MLSIKILRNQFGFSLAEMMVAVGLLGGVSLVTMKVIQSQAQNQSNLKMTDAVNKASLIVQTMMSNNQRCNEMMVGKTRNNGTNYTLQIASTGGNQVFLAPLTTYAEGFRTGSITLVTSSLGTGVTDLVMEFFTRAKAVENRVNDSDSAQYSYKITKRVSFVSELSGNVIKSCGSVLSDSDLTAKKMMCDSLGAAAATWTSGTCVLRDMKCTVPGEVPFQFNSLGDFECMPITNSSIRNQIFNYDVSTCSPGQGVTLGPDAGGKIKAICTGVATGCPATTLSWTAGVNAYCTAVVAAASFGNTSVVSASAPSSGSATYLCDGAVKTWNLQSSPTPTCINTTLSCAAQTVKWSGRTKFCTFTTSATYQQGEKPTLTDSTAQGGTDGTGSAVFECTNGVLGIVGNGTCCTTPGACTD